MVIIYPSLLYLRARCTCTYASRDPRESRRIGAHQRPRATMMCKIVAWWIETRATYACTRVRNRNTVLTRWYTTKLKLILCRLVLYTIVKTKLMPHVIRLYVHLPLNFSITSSDMPQQLNNCNILSVSCIGQYKRFHN